MPGEKYVVFQTGNKGEFTLNLSEAIGTFAAEWLNVGTGETMKGKPVKAEGVRTFQTPFGGPGVLYLRIIG